MHEDSIGRLAANTKLIHSLDISNPSLASYLFTLNLTANLLPCYQTLTTLFYRSQIETLEILTIKFYWPQQQEGNTNTQHWSKGAKGTQERSNLIDTKAIRFSHHHHITVTRRIEEGQFNPQAAKFSQNQATSSVCDPPTTPTKQSNRKHILVSFSKKETEKKITQIVPPSKPSYSHLQRQFLHSILWLHQFLHSVL